MKAIIACDPTGGIGMAGKLPWTKIEGDLPRFKILTQDSVVVMGRNTWDSLPKKPLPGRLNIILSNSKLELPNGALQTNNINHFTHYTNVWLIGGAKLIESCWHTLDTIHLSVTHTQYGCDTFIDLIKLHKEFTQISSEELVDHSYKIWKRK
jgi:dihydrofolate reductase